MNYFDMMELQKNEENYLSINQLCETFCISEKKVYKIIKNNNVNFITKLTNNGSGKQKKLYNLKQFIDGAKKADMSLSRGNDISCKIANVLKTYSYQTLFLTLGEVLKNETSEKCFELSDQLTKLAFNKLKQEKQKIIQLAKNKIEEKNNIINNQNNLLKDLSIYKTTNEFLIKTKQSNKALRAEIVKKIRNITKDFNNYNSYQDNFVYYYKLYDKMHNFSKPDNYKNYINVIEKRGHLKEFLKIIENNNIK